MILLDTCALLWLNGDRTALSEAAIQAMTRYSDGLAVSPASMMEIGVKHRKGKLNLPRPLREWADAVSRRYALTLLPINQDIAVRFNELPDIHNDPFDRLIIATALNNNMRVVTADEIFGSYPGLEVIW